MLKSIVRLLNPKFVRFAHSVSIPRSFSRPIKIPNDVYKVSAMVEELASSSMLDDAIVLVMESTKMFDNPVVPWNILLTHVAGLSKLKLAFKLFQEMKIRQVKPNERTYTILLSGCASSPAPSAPDKARRIIEEMKRMALKNPEQFSTSAQTYSSSVTEKGKSSQKDHEREPMNEAGNPTIFHYNNLLKVYSRQNKLVDMINLYDSMCNRAKIPDHEYSAETCDSSTVAPVKPDIITYTIVANNLALLKTDEGFRQALSVWQDMRDDIAAHPATESILVFDDHFMHAIVTGSLHSLNKELKLKGLEILDKACGLKLGVEFPTTPSYQELPTLNALELSQISECLKNNPRPHLLDIALRSLAFTGNHHLASKVFFALVKPTTPFHPAKIEPDLRHISLVLSCICENAKEIIKHASSVQNLAISNQRSSLTKLRRIKPKKIAKFSNHETKPRKVDIKASSNSLKSYRENSPRERTPDFKQNALRPRRGSSS